MRALQEKQSLALQTQQSQSEMLMRQLQSQMEAEMKMKTELARHQMQILAELQPTSAGSLNLEEMVQKFTGSANANQNGNNAVRKSSDQMEEMYRKREERLKTAHSDEIEVIF